LCTPEPLDENDEPAADLRFSERPIETLLPGRRTPELARNVADLAGLCTLSHATVCKETLDCGEHIENDQFHVGWFAGTQLHEGAKLLRLAIDGKLSWAASNVMEWPHDNFRAHYSVRA
jgi:hypothetical protein